MHTAYAASANTQPALFLAPEPVVEADVAHLLYSAQCSRIN